MRGWFERGVRGGNAEYAEVFLGEVRGWGAGLIFHRRESREAETQRVRGWFSRVERGERVEGALRAISGLGFNAESAEETQSTQRFWGPPTAADRR